MNEEALRRELEETKKALNDTRDELAAHEGLVRVAMDDMRRIYDDFLATQTHLHHSDKLATVGLLTAGIVHEINNPLTIVHGNLTLLRDSALSTEQAERVADSIEAIERIMAIVRDIRTFSRTDKGESAPRNLNDVVESVIRLVTSQIKHKAAIESTFGNLPPVKCNAQQLSQVFLNLLVNAAQAIRDSGTIRVTTRVEGAHAAVDIADDGCGMTPEVKARLFEPFFTTKPAEQGTGMGLMISADIVKRHGGEIRVESTPGKGTVFTVLLPL